MSDGHPPERVMGAAFGLGALLLVPVLLTGDPGPLTSAGGLALALFLGVVPTALAYVLFARGLRRLSAAETSTLTLAEPLTAGLLGAVVLGERLTALSGVGAGLVLAGLLVLAVRVPRPAPVAA
jgi:DME family drug/metabolite transporter